VDYGGCKRIGSPYQGRGFEDTGTAGQTSRHTARSSYGVMVKVEDLLLNGTPADVHGATVPGILDNPFLPTITPRRTSPTRSARRSAAARREASQVPLPRDGSARTESAPSAC
jgi:hypothetical protein